MTDPKRLRELPDLPASLRDALRTLERQAPAQETVARVQRSLEALPAPGSAAVFGFGWGAALFVATLGVLGWTGWAFLSQPRASDAPRAHSDEARSTPTAAVAVPAPAAPASVPALQPSAAPSLGTAPALAAAEPVRVASSGLRKRQESERAPRARSRDAAERAGVATTGTPRSAAGAATGTLALSADAPDPLARAADAPDPLASTVTESEVQATPDADEVVDPAARAAKQPLVVAPAPGPEPEDEAGLLYRAKRLARRDPAAALRLAESHALHFPQGAFVEEREVLAIELEKRLGHDAEAKQRAASFLARFPNSAYRGAIQR
jgi:hypothetical protein